MTSYVNGINYWWFVGFFLTQFFAIAIPLLIYYLVSIREKRKNNKTMKLRFKQTLNKLKQELKGLKNGLESQPNGYHDFCRYLNLTFWESAVSSGLILQFDDDDLFYELHDVVNISKVIDDRLRLYYEFSVKTENTDKLVIYIGWCIDQAMPKIEKVLQLLK